MASLNYYFTYVLHYELPGDSIHNNHVHADNAISGYGGVLSTGRGSQVSSVQAILTYIWYIPTAIDGRWGPQTDGNSRLALSRMGRSGGLTSSQANWMAFNHESLRRGTGDDG